MKVGRILAVAAIGIYVAFGGSGVRAESVGGRCDRLAAGPDDPARRGEPVQLADLDWRMAIMACRAAAAKEPRVARWHYQLGRALLAAGRAGDAERAWGRAAIFDYAAALFELGRARMPGPSSLMTMYASDAYSLLWRAANQGHAGAAEAVGRAHQYGTGGVPRSLEEAARWYAVAAAEGNVSAMRRLAAMYRNGTGVQRDIHKATVLLGKAAATGDTASMNALGWLHLGNAVDRDRFERAARWFDRAGAQADREGLYEIGRARLLAAIDDREIAVALGLLRRAAELGSQGARHALGVAYLDDPRLEPDEVLARTYLTRAAAAGLSSSAVRLGRLAEEGLTEERDPTSAAEWYRRAAEAGDAEGMARLAALHERGAGVPRDRPAALLWYRRGAEEGHTPAQIALAQLLLAGQPPHEDREQALTWLLIAGLLGSGEARTAGGELANGLPFETLNEARQAADRWVRQRRGAVTD